MTLDHAASVRGQEGNAREPLGRDDALAFLRSALASATGPVAVVLPAPAKSGLGMLARLRKCAAFHVSHGDRSLTTLGARCSASLAGDARFEQATAFYDRVRDLRVVAHERCAGIAPVMTAGFAFAPLEMRDVWTSFGDGAVTLPRWAHRTDRGRGSLVFAPAADEPPNASFALAELDAIWSALEAGTIDDPAPFSARATHVDEARWARSIDDVRARIASGEAQKVVVARRSIVVADRDFDPIAIARTLARPSAHVFLIRRGHATFVGATPEHLFQKRRLAVRMDALAGTVSLARDPRGAALFASEKDRSEHAFVVDAIVERLSSLGAHVSVAAPVLRTIGDIGHLATPIHAALARDVSPFTIADRLHPTPAVGGVPRAVALDWIARNEPDRGWYAGPVGWVDFDGNAELLVALRSALVMGARAIAYAGCGVVGGSRSHAEYVETRLKLAPMLAALGVAA
jgi:salicylate biosynthesis isochorismate synthase